MSYEPMSEVRNNYDLGPDGRGYTCDSSGFCDADEDVDDSLMLQEDYNALLSDFNDVWKDLEIQKTDYADLEHRHENLQMNYDALLEILHMIGTKAIDDNT